MRRGWATGVLMLAIGSSDATTLFEPPTHLRFSAAEVSAAAHRFTPAPEQVPASSADRHALRVQDVWRRLLAAADEQPGGRASGLRLVLAADDASAHARVDGSVHFPPRLAEALALSDEEIAFILAHEIVHVLLEHEREVLTAADLLLRPDVRRSADDVYAALQFDLGLSLKTSFLMQAAELEADAIGLQLAALAGFDPDRQVGALAKLLQPRAALPSVLATHPGDAERLQRLAQTLAPARAVYRRGSDASAP